MSTPYIQIENLTKSFGSNILLDEASFSISEGQRIGLIAQNGAGKTTLLRILSGEEQYDFGLITIKRDLRIGYLQQEPNYPKEITILEACFYNAGETAQTIKEYERAISKNDIKGIELLIEKMDNLEAWDYEQRAKQILSKLNINDFDKKIGLLSGGELKRIALANVLINEPEILILDEPTNHLDLDMTEWLENFLSKTNITLLMVTHDRYFLDRVCNEIIEIDNKKIYSYKGNYSYYLEKRQERVDAKTNEIARANNLYRTELEWMRRMPQARGHKAKYREDAFYDLEKVAKQNITQQNIKLEVKASYIGSKIFEAQGIYKSFGEKKILENFSYVFSRYEKMGIIGGNGVGKSTFLKILLNEIKADKGKIDVGETVRFGYYSQKGLTFNENAKVIDIVQDIAEVIDIGDGKMLTASQMLQHFLFTPEKQHNFVAKLSGGERRRLYLCTVLMTNPNFLVLDEPTNDLDIVTLNILEEYLKSFKGCVIVVSHDRCFMDKVVEHILVFNGNADIKDFPGNYTQYRNWKEETEEAEASKKEKAEENKAEKVRLNDKKKMSFKEKMEFEQLEKEIPQLESKLKEMQEKLCGGTIDVEEITQLSKELPKLQEEIDEKTMRWLELSEML